MKRVAQVGQKLIEIVNELKPKMTDYERLIEIVNELKPKMTDYERGYTEALEWVLESCD